MRVMNATIMIIPCDEHPEFAWALPIGWEPDITQCVHARKLQGRNPAFFDGDVTCDGYPEVSMAIKLADLPIQPPYEPNTEVMVEVSKLKWLDR
jgi:hypothetical protein